MILSANINGCFFIWTIGLLLFGQLLPVESEEKMLARLSFWVPPEQMEEFEVAYEQEIVPILNRHGLIPSSVQGRPTVVEVFSRLIELEKPSDIGPKWYSVWSDSAYQNVLNNQWQAFRETHADISLGGVRPSWYPTQVPNYKLRPLGVPHNIFAEHLSNILGAILGPSVIVKTKYVDQIKNGDFIRLLSNPTCSYVFDIQPSGGAAIVVLSWPITNALIDQQLGVSEDRLSYEAHTLTASERSVMQVVVTHMLAALEKTWGEWSKIEVSEGRLETTPELLTTVTGSLSDLVILAGLEVNWEHGSGDILLCYPYTTLASVSSLIEMSSVQSNISLYTSPAGSGEVVSIGTGKRVSNSRGDGHWRSYDVLDGLASFTVSSISQDRDGYLWFGTDAGLSRYSGQEFKNFTKDAGLAGHNIFSICQDREERLWFGTNRGLSQYYGKEFKTVTNEHHLPHHEVLSIYEDRKGNLWFGTMGGVTRYDGQEPKTFTREDGLAHNEVLSIYEDQDGNLWFGTVEGVSRYDGNRFSTFTTQDGLPDNHDFFVKTPVRKGYRRSTICRIIKGTGAIERSSFYPYLWSRVDVSPT